MQKEGPSTQLSRAGSILDRMPSEASGGSLYLWRGHPACEDPEAYTEILSGELKKRKDQHD